MVFWLLALGVAGVVIDCGGSSWDWPVWSLLADALFRVLRYDVIVETLVVFTGGGWGSVS